MATLRKLFIFIPMDNSAANTAGGNSGNNSNNNSNNNNIDDVKRMPIFKQISTVTPYSPNMSEDEFVESLSRFLLLTNIPLARKPSFHGIQLPLHQFFRSVLLSGGYEILTQKNQWSMIATAFSLNQTTNPPIPDVINQVKKFYFSIFFAYEQYFYRGIQLEDIVFPRFATAPTLNVGGGAGASSGIGANNNHQQQQYQQHHQQQQKSKEQNELEEIQGDLVLQAKMEKVNTILGERVGALTLIYDVIKPNTANPTLLNQHQTSSKDLRELGEMLLLPPSSSHSRTPLDTYLQSIALNILKSRSSLVFAPFNGANGGGGGDDKDYKDSLYGWEDVVESLIVCFNDRCGCGTIDMESSSTTTTTTTTKILILEILTNIFSQPSPKVRGDRLKWQGEDLVSKVLLQALMEEDVGAEVKERAANLLIVVAPHLDRLSLLPLLPLATKEIRLFILQNSYRLFEALSTTTTTTTTASSSSSVTFPPFTISSFASVFFSSYFIDSSFLEWKQHYSSFLSLMEDLWRIVEFVIPYLMELTKSTTSSSFIIDNGYLELSLQGLDKGFQGFQEWSKVSSYHHVESCFITATTTTVPITLIKLIKGIIVLKTRSTSSSLHIPSKSFSDLGVCLMHSKRIRKSLSNILKGGKDDIALLMMEQIMDE